MKKNIVECRHEDDRWVVGEIARLRSGIETWAKSHDLWYDASFKDYISHVGGELPESPVATVLCFDGPLNDVLFGEDPMGLESEFRDILNEFGCGYESGGPCAVNIHVEDASKIDVFNSYFKWQWICNLVKPDFDGVYNEIYEYFKCNPDHLYHLHWRKYEEILAAIFQSQGFQVELGPGRGDGGVDIKLLQRDPIGDILTLVQVKKYADHNKIDLQPVAALHGICDVEGAQKSLFITTSTYAPVAKTFSERTSGRMTLAVSSDVANWCRDAAEGIIQDKSKLVSPHHVRRIVEEVSKGHDPRVVVAHGGWNMTIVDFALIIKESKHAALLMSLKSKIVSDDGYGQQGDVVPVLDGSSMDYNADSVWRASRSVYDEGRVAYWDGHHLYSPWDGRPQHFCYYD